MPALSVCASPLFGNVHGPAALAVDALHVAESDSDSSPSAPVLHQGVGLVEGYDDELGYFSIKEMEELNRQMGFAAIERDEHFEPKSLSAVRGR